MRVESFDRRDFNRAAVFLCNRLTLTALSKAEKTADMFLALESLRAPLRIFFKVCLRFRLRAVLVLSLRIFLMALLRIGITEQILTWALLPCNLQCYN